MSAFGKIYFWQNVCIDLNFYFALFSFPVVLMLTLYTGEFYHLIETIQMED